MKSGADEGHTDQIKVCKGQESQDESELSKGKLTIQPSYSHDGSRKFQAQDSPKTDDFCTFTPKEAKIVQKLSHVS